MYRSTGKAWGGEICVILGPPGLSDILWVCLPPGYPRLVVLMPRGHPQMGRAGSLARGRRASLPAYSTKGGLWGGGGKANLCLCLCLLAPELQRLMPGATPGLGGREDRGVDTCRPWSPPGQPLEFPTWVLQKEVGTALPIAPTAATTVLPLHFLCAVRVQPV